MPDEESGDSGEVVVVEAAQAAGVVAMGRAAGSRRWFVGGERRVTRFERCLVVVWPWLLEPRLGEIVRSLRWLQLADFI